MNFLVPGPGPYALTHSVGCVPHYVSAAIEEGFLAPWAAEGGSAWDKWLAQIDVFRANLARLLGGKAAEYCPQTNISSGLAKLLPALTRLDRRRRVIVVAEDAFPSVGFVLAQAKQFGVTTRLLPRTANPADSRSWRSALGPEVLAAVVTHVHSNTGVISPVGEIAAYCCEKGAICILDVAQSAGIVPFRVEKCGAHVVLGSCVKWLCGGPGAGFMWIDPELVSRLEPVDVGWFSHANPFEFDIRSFVFAQDARRFWGGTPSVVPYIVANVALNLLGELGVPALRRHNTRLLELFVREAGVESLTPELSSIGGALCIPFGGALESVVNALRSSSVRFDCRGPIVRLSFHLYNSEDDAVRAGRAVRLAVSNE